MSEYKRRRGDRVDGRWYRNPDPLHVFMPYIYPNRADNEAFIRLQLDLTALDVYLARKNEGLPKSDRYTLMQAICAALVHTITLRPKMNRFIKGNRIYERDKVSLAFVVKKQFNDESEEALAFKKFGPETTFDSLHREIVDEIHACRSDRPDPTTGAMVTLGKLPRWLLGMVMGLLHKLDFYGLVPQSLVGADPNHATAMLTNLGSLGLDAGYHHLSNWGTMSIFVVIGKMHMAPIFADDGSYEMKHVVDIGITLDERIADGYYYAQTVKLIQHILTHPELLDDRADTEVIL